ncbi:hypothetical protein [Terribacillus halophilus]|nr:hypothetical protein [Terribacillus halophilus]
MNAAQDLRPPWRNKHIHGGFAAISRSLKSCTTVRGWTGSNW